jgi:hypothetical protein
MCEWAWCYGIAARVAIKQRRTALAADLLSSQWMAIGDAWRIYGHLMQWPEVAGQVTGVQMMPSRPSPIHQSWCDEASAP